MAKDFIDKKDIQNQNLINKTIDFMVSRFRQLQQNFSYSDPYGQIILVLQNLTKINIFYVKDSINEMSYHTAARPESIYGLAQLNGHNAHRGTGATGSVAITFKKDGTASSTLTDVVYLPNYMKLRCTQNGLFYYLNLGTDFIKYDVAKGKKVSISVVQGDMKTTPFTGSGEDIQTYSIPLGSDAVDMNNIIVQVNGQKCLVHEGIAEFEYGKLNCIVRTGLAGGIDIIFGKSINSLIPLQGEAILVFFSVVAGNAGNEDFPVFDFVDTGYKTTGENVNMNEFFTVVPENRFLFGSDGENVEETKLVAPLVDKNRIVHDRRSTEYFFRKLNLFGNVKVFNEDQPNVMETVLFPKLENVVGDNEDYFNLNREKVFLLDSTIQRLLELVNPSRSQNVDVVIRNPQVKNYSMIIKADAFRYGTNGLSVNIEELQNTIRDVVSDFMLLMRRTEKIPKSDIVKTIDNIDNIDSVFVEFVVEEEGMLDNLGNIKVGNAEIALPSSNFVDFNGNQIAKSIEISVELIEN